MSSELWNIEVGRLDEATRIIVLEQYKVYVASIEKTSDRRALTNTFFVTLNASAFVAIGVLWEHQPNTNTAWLALPLAAALTICGAWFYILWSYRRVNTAKFEVVGELESGLPTSPFWGAEWGRLGRGNDPKLYVPLSVVESAVPAAFASIYLIGAIAVWLN